jgi:hypothetical protein
MYQVSVPVLIQAAERFCARVGEADTAPADRIVVVPEVTAEMVQRPAPLLRIVMTDPTGIAAVALVGIFRATAVALFIDTRT